MKTNPKNKNHLLKIKKKKMEMIVKRIMTRKINQNKRKRLNQMTSLNRKRKKQQIVKKKKFLKKNPKTKVNQKMMKRKKN